MNMVICLIAGCTLLFAYVLYVTIHFSQLAKEIEQVIDKQNKLMDEAFVSFYFQKGLHQKPSDKDQNTCVCCGDVIPEGQQICPKCENKM